MVLAHCEEICWNKKVFVWERGLGEECGRVPHAEVNPSPGWFFTLHLRRWSIPLMPGCCQCTPGARDGPWKSIHSPQRGWDSALGQSHLFYPSTHLHSTGLGNCVTTQRLVFKTDRAGSTALHIQLRCTHKLPSLCAGKWAAKDFFRNCFRSRYIPAQAGCPNPLGWLDLCRLIQLLNRLCLGKKILTADHEKLG